MSNLDWYARVTKLRSSKRAATQRPHSRACEPPMLYHGIPNLSGLGGGGDDRDGSDEHGDGYDDDYVGRALTPL